MKKNFKILISVSLILIILIATASLCFFYKTQKNQNISNQRNFEKLPVGAIGYGVYDFNKKIIDNGSIINIKNNYLKTTVNVSQNLNENRKYALIILCDFIQQKFKVGGTKNTSYEFNIDKKSNMDIDTELEVPKSTKELDYIIIKKPDYLLKDMDFNRINILQKVLPIRFKVQDNHEEFKYEKNTKNFSEGPNDHIFLSKDANKLTLLLTATEQEKIALSVGNINKINENYAVILFSDWQQQSFDDGEKVKYFNINPNERKSLDITLPNTNSEKNFQAIAFPCPYSVSRDNSNSTEAYGSARLVALPKIN